MEPELSSSPENALGRRSEHRGNRYRRSNGARLAVLQAADDLLSEIGFAAVTIEGIAARAGVGKQTIYRWWQSKADVLMEAFAEDALQDLRPPDTGNLKDDLKAHLSHTAKFLTESDAGAVFRALAGQIQHDPVMAVRFRTEYFERQRELDRIPLLRAVEREELSKDIDIETAIDRLMGPIYFRVLVTGQPINQDFTDELVTHFLRSSA